jgi:membrane fusion protein (multidrug efflux system)
MKKVLFSKVVFAAILLINLAACKNNPSDQKAELDKLKKQQSDLLGKIDKLESSIALTDTSKKEEKINMVEVSALAPQLFTSYIEVQGKVDADENVTISPEAAGVVSIINVKAGDEVTKGQVLAELDAKVIQQTIAEFQNALDLANTMYSKQKTLWDQKIGSEVQYITAKNQKENIERRISTTQQQLEMTRIKSPINGTVDEVFLKLGQMASPGIQAFRVVNFANLKVKAEVPENYAAKVKKGNPAVVLFPDISDSVSAPVTFSAKVINAQNRTFNVELALDNNKEYHPNMIAILKIVDYTNKNALVIPVGTIQHAEEGDFVFIDENGKAKKARVRVGKIYNDKAEINSGLKEGDKLVTTGYQDLNEGEAIKY